MVTISFPGIGIDNFNVNPVAFNIPIFGGLQVRWYGIIITLGIILAFSYCAFRCKKNEGIKFDDLLDITIFTVIFGVIGARVYYVLMSLGEQKYTSFYDVIAIWEGGLAIYGGIIAGALTIYLICRHKKISPLKMLDAVAPGVMIGQLLGRWGNFFNGEAFGSEVAEDSIFYFIRMGLISSNTESARMIYVHPTFLYESLWNLLGFIIINFLYKKKKFDGQILLMYVTWYGFGRMLIEGLRTDSLMLGVFRISQVVGFVCFVVGAILLTVMLMRARRARLTAMDYAPTYGKISGKYTVESIENTDEDTDIANENTYNDSDGTQDTDDEDEDDVDELSDTEKKRNLNSLFEDDEK